MNSLKKRKSRIKGETLKALSLSALFLSFIFLINFVSADLSLGMDGKIGVDLIPEVPINYSQVNVNNSPYLQGYTPTTLKDWIQGLFDSVYCQLTGCTMSGNLIVNANVTADYFKGDLEIDYLTDSSNTTIQDYVNAVQSAGRISGGEFTDNGDGTITVNAGLGFIKTSNNQIGNTVFFEWETNTSVPLYNGSISRIFIDYNSGNPIVKKDGGLNHNTQVSLGTAFLCSLTNEVHILSGGQPAFNLARLVHYRLREPGITKISGALLGEPDGLNLSVTEGVFWAGLNRFTTGSFDSTLASDNFSYFYQNGSGGWYIEEEISVINNTHYDDGTGTLNELTVNRYGVHWVYNDNDGHIWILFGYGDYVLGGASNAEPPTTVPTILSEFGTLLGKIIVQKGDTTFTEIKSILPEDIPPSVVTEHSDLSGLGDDDHTQYLLADGTRELTGNWDTGVYNITTYSKHSDGTAQGQMAFWDATLGKWVYTETSELFWDDVNKRLGRGIATPGAPLELYKATSVTNAPGGGIILSRYNLAGNYRGGAIYNMYNGVVDVLAFAVTTYNGRNPYLDFDQIKAVLTANGEFGLGTTTPVRQFHLWNSANAQFQVEGHSSSESLGNGEVSLIFKNDHANVNTWESIIFQGDSGTVGAIEVQNIDQANKYGDMHLVTRGADGYKTRLKISSNGNICLNCTTSNYPFEVHAGVSNISVWASHQYSGTGYITRTSVFDTSLNAFDFIKDADYYLDEGEINHSKFYGQTGKLEITDYSKPEIEQYIGEECEENLTGYQETTNEECNIIDGKIVCQNVITNNPTYENINCEKVIKENTIYPYKKQEEGVELGREIDVLRQALAEIKSCTETSKDWLEYQICVNGV